MNKWYVLLLNMLLCAGVSNFHAMEHEKDIEPKGAESEEGPSFAQLDHGTTLDVIVGIAQAGTLQEAVENIRNLALVNKKFNGLINSEAGINEIIKEGLLENKNIQEFFDYLVTTIESVKKYSMIPADLALLKVYITEKDKQKVLLLALLGTRQAQELFKQKIATDIGKQQMNSILAALSTVAGIVGDKKIELKQPFKESFLYLLLQLAEVFSILKIAFPTGIKSLLEIFMEHYPEDHSNISQGSELFKYSKTFQEPLWYQRMQLERF